MSKARDISRSHMKKPRSEMRPGPSPPPTGDRRRELLRRSGSGFHIDPGPQPGFQIDLDALVVRDLVEIRLLELCPGDGEYAAVDMRHGIGGRPYHRVKPLAAFPDHLGIGD